MIFLLPSAAFAADDIPAWLISLPDSVATVFVAETDASAIHVYEHTDGDISLGGTYYISIGRNGAGKQRSGDRRTPIGTYFVTEQLDTSRLHEKYGVTAFPLDYPNRIDERHERSGDGIWVHGVDPNGGRRPALDTDGCIALPNEDLLQLQSLFKPGRTPVLISTKLRTSTDEERESLAAAIETAVRRWSTSLAAGDMHTFLAIYDDDFRYRSMDRDAWSAFAVQTLGAREIESVDISDLLILGYPGEDELVMSRFRLAIAEPETTVTLDKRLYWRKGPGGEYRIFAEDSG